MKSPKNILLSLRHMKILVIPVAVLLAGFLHAQPASNNYAYANRPSAYANCQTAVVLDFSVAPRVVEKRDCCTRRIGYTEKELQTEKDYRGWWLGRQHLYFNSNVGRMAADVFSDYLRDNGVFSINSRENLKYYYADKRDLIKAKLNLKGEGLERALWQLDPVMIGKEMGVDKVIVGHICDSELRKTMAIGSFASAVSMSVAVFDVKTGRLEYDRCFNEILKHTTQFFHYEDIAERFGEDIRHVRAGSYSAPWHTH